MAIIGCLAPPLLLTRRLVWGVLTGVIAFVLWPVCSAEAAIYLGGTRVIVNSQEKEATLRVVSEGSTPVLLQVWVDSGDSKAAPGLIAVPFTVTPPILRLDSKRSQRLRILFTGDESQLAGDRESVFWLNVLEIPPKPRADVERNRVQVAFRSRIKLFYRPSKLRKDNATDSHQQLRFNVIRQGKAPVLQINNPTPFHQTLLDLAVGRDQHRPVAKVTLGNGMVAPYQQQQITLDQVEGSVTDGMWVFYSVIDDLGNVVTGEQVLP